MSNYLQQIDSHRQAGAASRGVLLLVSGVILLLIIAVVLLYPRPVSEPELATAGTVAIPPASKEARGDAARDIIAELQNKEKSGTAGDLRGREETAGEESTQAGSMDVDAGSGDEGSTGEEPVDKGTMDNVEAYTRAQAFHAEGKLADAQLLYYFAARGGYAPAAFDLASFYDPNLFSKETSLMNDPDPFQAYKWYKKSLELGRDDAEARLAALHAWAEDAAGTGNMKAEQLLLVWE